MRVQEAAELVGIDAYKLRPRVGTSVGHRQGDLSADDGRMANLRHGKGGKQRVVPITDTVDDDEIRAAMTAAVAG